MSYIDVIRHGNFSKLWAAQILSLIAQNMLNFALIIRVFDLTQGTRFANVAVSMLVLSFGVSALLFSAVAGIYVDHWNRKNVLVISNILRAILVLGYLVIENKLALVLILTFMISSITQFFAPAEASTIPVLVGKKLLLGANALFVLTFYATFIVGYSASAPVIKIFGSTGPYFLTAGMFFIAAALTFWLPKVPPASTSRLPLRHLVHVTHRELQHNWQAIVSNRNLYFPIMQLSLMQVMVGIILTLAPALSLALLKMNLKEASPILVIPTGIGMVSGVMLVGIIARRIKKLTLITGGLVTLGAALSLLGLTGQLNRQFRGAPVASFHTVALIVIVLMFILGFMNAVVSVSAQTLLQESSTDATRGRIFGALYMVMNIAATLPIFVAGVLADLWSVTRLITVVGLAVLGFALFQIIFLRPTLPSSSPVKPTA